MKTKQFNIKNPNTQYKLNIKYDGYTSNTIIINSRTVFYVKTTDDGGDDEKDGKTWSTAFSTIDTALGAADAISPSATNLVEIWVAAGEYKISSAMAMIKFVSIYGSFAGTENTKEERQILDKYNDEYKLFIFKSPLKPTTIINNTGTSTSSSRHFKTSLDADTAITPASVTIDGICFTRAKASSINSEYTSPTFSNCVWYNNSGNAQAGAVYNKYSSPKFYNCQFINNTAGTIGGAIMYDTGNADDISIIDNCIFYNNLSKQDGSAIYAHEYNNIKITNSIIDTNKTTNDKKGGSIFINDKATVEISDSYIIYNNDIGDKTYCGTGVRLKGNASKNSAKLVANNVIFYKNTSSTKKYNNIDYSNIDIGRDYTPNQSPAVANRPIIQITKCKLDRYDKLYTNYSLWFNTNDGASSWSNNTEISTNDEVIEISDNGEANIKAKYRATTKIDPSYS